MMRPTRSEQRVLAGLGMLAALLVTGLAWPQRRAPLALQGAPDPATVDWPQRLAAARQVDLNRAGVSELERLPGVGPRLAQRIIAYREAHGAFQAIEELARVRGIGPKTVDALRDDIVVR